MWHVRWKKSLIKFNIAWKIKNFFHVTWLTSRAFTPKPQITPSENFRQFPEKINTFNTVDELLTRVALISIENAKKITMEKEF